MNTDRSNFFDSLSAILERWRLLLLVVALSTGMALVVSLASEKQYDATAQLLLRGAEPINSLLDPGSSGSSDPERDLNTEVELITVGPTARAVQRALGLRRTADDLIAQVKPEVSSTSNIVRLRVRDPDPELAARIANAFAGAYVRFRADSARARYREAAELAQRQLLALSPLDRRTLEGRELQSRQRELQIAAALQTGGAELVRRASVPESASRPRPLLSAALGMLLGLMLGVGAALMLSLLDRRFKDERGVEAFFDLPVLAGIPRPLRRGDDVDDPAQRDAFGLLAANLHLASFGGAKSVLMITSPGPADGKTSVTLGIARAYVQLGLSVVVIEADLRRPAFGRIADVTRSAGVTGVIAGRTFAEELIWLDADTLRPSAAVNGGRGAIALLPAGKIPANPQRVLSDPAMSMLVRVARAQADVVLIDTAPVGTVNDATMLAPIVEGVVVVARLNQTTKDAARRASRPLGNLGAELLGLVITDAGGDRTYYGEPMPAAREQAERPRSSVQGGRD